MNKHLPISGQEIAHDHDHDHHDHAAAHGLALAPDARFWRSVEEKSSLQAGHALEPTLESKTIDVEPSALFSRRGFMQASSIAAASAALAGCMRRPEQHILPYSKAPEHAVPGVVQHFASVTARGRDALGIVVTSNDGRPTKIEGNKDHPSSLGASDIQAQAQIWNLYDPSRSRKPAQRQGNTLIDSALDTFDGAFGPLIPKYKANQGQGLFVLSTVSNSPSLRRMRAGLAKEYPKSRWFSYSSVNDDNARAGARMALGAPHAFVPNYEKAMCVVSLDADFLGSESGAVRAGRGFGVNRRVESPGSEMSRLYIAESNFSVTGSMADHRFRMKSSAVLAFAADLARGFGVATGESASEIHGVSQSDINAIVEDLKKFSWRSLVVAGATQPPEVHALAWAINATLGSINASVMLGPVVDEQDPTGVEALQSLKKEIAQASTLLILGGNPVYDAPSDVDLKSLLARDGLTSIHLSSHRNETSELCSWHVPESHELEAWGDQQALDGTLSIQQPLIAPLFESRSALELIAYFIYESPKPYDIVRATLLELRTAAMVPAEASLFGPIFESEWRKALHSGVYQQLRKDMANTSWKVDNTLVSAAVEKKLKELRTTKDKLEVVFRADPKMNDGEFANNLWCLELPDPMTKIVWDNAALMSISTRDKLALKDRQFVKVRVGERSVEIPVWAVPGHADNSITLNLGWGRSSAGAYGNGKGFDVQPLRSTLAFNIAQDVKVEAKKNFYNIVQTQEHDRMEGRPIAIDATLDEYKEEPDFASYRSVEFQSTPPLWKEVDYSTGHQWGMVIDLSACTGCSACVVACQSENNIPNVGKREVERGREMHWIRIDRYFTGSDENPEAAIQPVACQHCEEAPCENVCPVNATAHNPEGLNEMTYNRCIGTRYCANNCPYKVRRFNYLEWHAHLDGKDKWYGDIDELRKMQFNPNVTVRMRGVMEKCTYCVQRIQTAKISAKRDDQPMSANAVTTACQQACPTQAIVFGDLLNKESEVSKLALRDRRYKLLAEIGTQPRTTYLAKIRNLNPQIAKPATHAAKGGGHS